MDPAFKTTCPILSSSSPVDRSTDSDDTCDQSIGAAALKRLISAVYSGPTLSDIQNALFVTSTATAKPRSSATSHHNSLLTRMMMGTEREMNKGETKYTLKMKCNGNGMADDGYKWRKYGQKSIRNSPNPRSYYKCTNPRCSAKKQVERSLEDAETLIITYEGLHLHFAFPNFFSGEPNSDPPSPPSKKARREEEPQHKISNGKKQPRAEETNLVGLGEDTTGQVRQDSPTSCGPVSLGLLEDVVPIAILNPASSTSSYSDSCSSSPPPFGASTASPISCSSLSGPPAPYSPLFFDFDAFPAFPLD